MRYRLVHITTYHYESVVSQSRHVIRKRPRISDTQKVLRSYLTTLPGAVWSERAIDYFGNEMDTVEVSEPHESLVVRCESDVIVEPSPDAVSSPLFDSSWEKTRDRVAQDPACFEAREFVEDSPLVLRSSALLEFGRSVFTPNRPILEAINDLNRKIHETFEYDSTATEVSTPLETVMREKRGVCQDFAHIATGVLRAYGLAGQYVSGYLETLPPPGKPRLVGADASHAWARVYVPDIGYVAFDPTNNVIPAEQHIVVAYGRDYSDVSPLRGVVLGGGRHSIHVSVDVARILGRR